MLRRSFCVLISVIGMILVLPFAVFAEEGVTNRKIHIGSFGPLTGPAALWGDVLRGADFLFRMINDEGGIHGRRIVYHYFDDGYNPARTQAGVKKLQENVGIFAWQGGVGSETGLSIVDYLTNRRIPWVGPLAGTDQWVNPPRKNVFALYPHYQLEAKVLCRYAVETLQKKRIAVVYQNDTYGKNGLKGGAEEMAMRNMDLVAAIPVERTQLDMDEVAYQLSNTHADAVLLWLTPVGALRVLSTCKTMDNPPQWMGSSSLSDFSVMYKVSKGLLKGMITANFADLSNTPLLQKYKKAYDKYNKPKKEIGVDDLLLIQLRKYKKVNTYAEMKSGIKWGMFFHAGIGFAEPLIEGLKRSGRNLTRERLIEAMESLRDFRGVGAPINFQSFDPGNPGCRQGMNKVYLIQCLEGGKSRRLTDWMGE